MAFPTSLNSQITDAITQANVQVLGSSPGFAAAALYQATAQALANAAHNATAAQQQMNVVAQAATTAGVRLLHAAGAPAVPDIQVRNVPGEAGRTAPGLGG